MLISGYGRYDPPRPPVARGSHLHHANPDSETRPAMSHNTTATTIRVRERNAAGAFEYCDVESKGEVYHDYFILGTSYFVRSERTQHIAATLPAATMPTRAQH